MDLNYGIVGNGTSAALIHETGSLDWMCLPNFESPSVFARLLDTEIGGFWSFALEGNYRTVQHYIRKTNILLTHFTDGENSFDLIDFMPRYKKDNGAYHCPPDLIRLLRPRRGKPVVRIRYEPRPGYARGLARHERTKDYLKSFTTSGSYESVYLYSDIDLRHVTDDIPVPLTEEHFFWLSYNQKISPVHLDAVQLEFERTKVYWMDWTTRTTPVPRYAEMVERSALVLKLLAYQKTGAILAAATTSLPESIGEVRNWDYRFCWIRDASMTINLLNRLGHVNVAKRFLQFVLSVIPYKDESIQIMYGIHGQKRLKERSLDWLAGYENSRPVRIGNEAFIQKQNDIYGVLLDVIYQSLCMYPTSMENIEDIWTVVRTLVRHLRNNWTRPDRGIWEYRHEKRHFTFSKVLCWVGADRGMRIAKLLGRTTYAQRWEGLSKRIREDILQKGWNPDVEAYTQSYGSPHLDAANLLMGHYGFLPPEDPRFQSTVLRTYERLARNGLMYRYKNEDDFGEPTSSFTVCSFWMIKSLYAIGKQELAISLFDELLGYGNHLGLFSEDLDFESKRMLGNFPQAYSHLALIDTAMTLSGLTPSCHPDHLYRAPFDAGFGDTEIRMPMMEIHPQQGS